MMMSTAIPIACILFIFFSIIPKRGILMKKIQYTRAGIVFTFPVDVKNEKYNLTLQQKHISNLEV